MADRILFVDRDGTLIEEPADQQIDSLDKLELVPEVIPALRTLRDAGYRLVIVSNQDGLGSAAYPQEAYDTCQRKMLQLFASQGVEFDAVFVCPHRPEDGCDCRKPRTGLLSAFLTETAVDVTRSAVVGDRDTDLQLAERLGLQGFLIRDGATDWPAVARKLTNSGRAASYRRRTKETDIEVSVQLDGSGTASIATGIGFFDHMLEQIAKHAGIDLTLSCRGDLEVDEHHTVEDTAIALGSALRDALGDKRGIGRYGFLLPMDESAAEVAVDLSGRACLVFEADFTRDNVGDLPTEMVRHFFASLADALGAAIHIRVRGDNNHHMIEACFKGLGRALRPALSRSGDALPTTKGVLA